MKVKVTFTFEVPEDSKLEPHRYIYILSDALHEFASRRCVHESTSLSEMREAAWHYAKKYHNSGPLREVKTKEVFDRCRVAHAMKSAVLTAVKMEEIDTEEE